MRRQRYHIIIVKFLRNFYLNNFWHGVYFIFILMKACLQNKTKSPCPRVLKNNSFFLALINRILALSVTVHLSIFDTENRKEQNLREKHVWLIAIVIKQLVSGLKSIVLLWKKCLLFFFSSNNATLLTYCKQRENAQIVSIT